MKQPTLDFRCPSCKKAAKITLAKKEFSTFQVRCPHCGATIQLESIKGFKQVKFRKSSKERIRLEFRDGESPSRN